ncbi:MotA/TolQ/ExbB proton channel family protein [Candidatus Palauibacter sp.]|uniref:MotA/TolQ/ExbB proton channel family protein n=1 Tax=Candidatus Palauibacter sp. TaxID=3101350 RepID=UPI003B027EF0
MAAAASVAAKVVAAEVVAVVQQLPERVIDSPLDMVLGATLPTKVILTVLAAFSLLSWILIIWKFRELRAVNRQADDFVFAMAGSGDLSNLNEALRELEDSPFRRVFREGIAFFSDLRPGALATRHVGEGLSSTQLEALWLTLEKSLSEERDELSHGLPWLAIIGSVSPLLGLMGTVVGVMNSFIGITSQGSANIAAVAPGIAEALTTTVAGLAVAIPAVIAYNHYASRLRLFTGELEGFASEFVGSLAREGRV